MSQPDAPRFLPIDAPANAGGVDPSYDDWETQILRLDLERALQSLSDAERAVATLYLYETQNTHAIARALQRPHAEVNALLQQALEKLRQALR